MTQNGISWTQWLLDRIIAQIGSIPLVSGTWIIAGDECVAVVPGATARDLGRLLDHSEILLPTTFSCDTAVQKLRIAYHLNPDRWAAYTGIMILDPLYPLRDRSHVHGAIQIYLSQRVNAPHRMPVVSFSRLPSRFHPKKILSIEHDGTLAYVDTAGASVYRRQQLDEDPYYVENAGIYIFDASQLQDQHGEDDVLGYIIDEPMPRAESGSELEWILAFENKPDSGGITRGANTS